MPSYMFCLVIGLIISPYVFIKESVAQRSAPMLHVHTVTVADQMKSKPHAMRLVSTRSFQSPFSDISSRIELHKSWGKEGARLHLAGLDSFSSVKLVSREIR